MKQFIGPSRLLDFRTSFNDNETTSRHDKKLSEENAEKAVLWSTEGSSAFLRL
jgi:hypothetical protein